MSAIKSVIIPGASGSLGRPTIEALKQAGFDVTALLREGSQATFSDGVAVKKTDYSAASLDEAMRGQDAVVCCLAIEGLKHQIPIIEASARAGVKRYITGEFGHAPDTPVSPEFAALLAWKKPAEELVMKLAKENSSFTWTSVATGSFADFLIAHSAEGQFALDLTNYTVAIRDSGNERIAMTSVPDTAAAVVQILQHPERTTNRWIKIRSLESSQNETLAEFEKQTGKTFTKSHIPTDVTHKEAQKALDEGNWFKAFVGFLSAMQAKDGSKGGYHVGPDNDNALVGLEETPVSYFVSQALKQAPSQ